MKIDTEKINSIKDPISVYLLSEKELPGIYEYAMDLGLNIQEVFTDIQKIKLMLLLQQEPSRVIITECGLGKFTSSAARKDIIDLAGMCGEDKKLCIFFTSKNLKEDITKSLGKVSKNIKWFKYKNTLDVINTIIELKEPYKKNESTEGTVGLTEATRFKGTEVDNQCTVSTVFSVLNNFKYDEKQESVEGFRINI